MAAPVWVLSVDLQTKTATFQSGMADAAKSARGAFTDIKSGSAEMSGAVGGHMFASRHAVMAVTESLGVQMPRAITALLVHIGPLGAALEAAFPFAAIALGAVLLFEHMEKLKEEGIKLTEDQTRFQTAVQNAFNALDQRLIQAQIKSDELRNDHLGALRLQLELIDKQSMDELVKSFSEVAKAADVVFADLKTSWYQMGIGSAGAKHALDEFQTKYDSLLAQGKDKEASDLLRGTRESAEKTLAAQKQIQAANAITDQMGLAVGTQAKDLAASNTLKAAGVGYSEKELKAQQTLVDALNAQVTLEGKVAALKSADKGNATTSTGKDLAALQAEGARESAEHARKMAEISLQMERETGEAALAARSASVAERLALDLHLADEETAIQARANNALIAALDRGGKDYNNQLKALQDKAAEITEEYEAKVAGLRGKASEAQYREDLATLESVERQKIEATEQGSSARLAAIDAAIKEQASKNLQETSAYRELLQQRVEAERAFESESGKLAAEAGKESAENAQKSGSVALASQHEMLQLANTLHRVSMQEQMDQDIAFANAEFDLKKASMVQEEAAMDKGAKDYENKLRAIQNVEKQLVQQHEDEVAAIRARAQAKQLLDERSAMASMENNFAAGFMQVLAGHRSFAALMASSAQTLTANLITAGIDAANHLDDDKMKQAESAARAGFAWGAKYGGPLAPVLAPTMAATFFAGVMAFQEGTDYVPGVGKGDKVPAMLEPGEGVVPGGVMDNLRSMARSGTMNGGQGQTIHVHVRPTYHLQALDTDGMAKILDKHSGTLARHFEKTVRTMNRG